MTDLTDGQIAKLIVALQEIQMTRKKAKHGNPAPAPAPAPPPPVTPPPAPLPAPPPVPIPAPQPAPPPIPAPEPAPAPLPAPEPVPAPPSPPSPTGSYPLSVINSGTQLAWDLQLPGAVGPRVPRIRRVGVDPLPPGAVLEFNGAEMLGIHDPAVWDAWLFDMAFGMGFDSHLGNQVFNDCEWGADVGLSAGGKSGGNYDLGLTTRGILNHCRYAAGLGYLYCVSGGFEIYRSLIEDKNQQVFQVYDPGGTIENPVYFKLEESLVRRFCMNPGIGSHLEAFFIGAKGEAHFINSLVDGSEAPTPPPNGAGWTGLCNIGGPGLEVWLDHSIFMGPAALNAIKAQTIWYMTQTGGPVIWHVKNCALSKGAAGYFGDVGTPLGATIIDEGGNYDFDTAAPINVSMTPP